MRTRGQTRVRTLIHRKDHGANLVEFAILAPFLILLLLGIIEFGWLMGVNNDVKHGAREGARFAAVDGGSNAAIRTYVCNAMEPIGGSGLQTLEIKLNQVDADSNGSVTIGDTGVISVRGTTSSLSGAGFIEVFLPSQLESTLDFRLEQNPASWSDDGATYTAVTC